MQNSHKKVGCVASHHPTNFSVIFGKWNNISMEFNSQQDHSIASKIFTAFRKFDEEEMGFSHKEHNQISCAKRFELAFWG